VLAAAAVGAPGQLDPEFGTRGVARGILAEEGVASSLALSPEGKIAQLGSSRGGIDNRALQLVRYRPKGSLDRSFGDAGVVRDEYPTGDTPDRALALAPGGALLVAGTVGSDEEPGAFPAIARYDRRGARDTAWGDGGVLRVGIPRGELRAIVRQPDGSVVVAGRSGTGDRARIALARVLATGMLDESFGVGGVVLVDAAPARGVIATALALQPDGKLLVAGGTGRASRFTLVRLMPDGTLDPAFGRGGVVIDDIVGSASERPAAVLVQPDRSIVVAGTAFATTTGGEGRFALVRYRAEGARDSAFGRGGLVTTDVPASRTGRLDALVRLPSGALVAGGYARVRERGFGLGVGYRPALVRYRRDGAIDRRFGTRGVALARFRGQATALLALPGGGVVAGGVEFDRATELQYFFLARFG
jgi:uncharacterized delta-60 repeat protein